MSLIPSSSFFSARYFPTRLWGYSGHVQTIIQGVVSRVVYPLINGKRYYFLQPDDTTVTYDLYQPTEQHTLNGEEREGGEEAGGGSNSFFKSGRDARNMDILPPGESPLTNVLD